MAGRRGAQQRGRSDVIQPEKTVRPGLPLAPGDPERPLYEALVAKMQVSGAEVLREGIRALYREKFGQPAPKQTVEAA
ncbi:hypothetical protein [Streptomyces alboflavus]|uniref:hypothetical protein n=1 Tax=Streptomyces alboflavus TaxID=67267 RepID=UPI000F657E89|nr:hypothetical protein [Streptomyces alboflavus]